MDENDEASLLKDIVATIIADKQGRARIDPSEVASEAMVILDPEGKSPQLVRHACELQLRKTATRMMDEEDEASRLKDVVAKIIVGRQDRTRINPSEVASEAMVILDPEGKSPQLVRQACELQLLKTAERMLGQSDDEDESDDVADQDQIHIHLDRMTDKNLEYNIGRLRRANRPVQAARLEEFWRRRLAESYAS